MSFKTVLAVVDYQSDLQENLQGAIRIARWFEAHLAVLLVGEVQPLPFYGYGGLGYTEIWVKEGEERAAALKQAAADVEALLAREGLPFDVRAHQAIVAREDNLVARHAIYADLTILRRNGEDDLSTVERQAIDGALFDSGRPLLFLPAGDASRDDRHECAGCLEFAGRGGGSGVRRSAHSAIGEQGHSDSCRSGDRAGRSRRDAGCRHGAGSGPARGRR